MGNKLEDLRVERVDGVDRPATGHRWIMMKSEAPVEKDTTALAKTALEALVKEEGLELTGETVEALKALAAALEVELDFAKADEAPEAEAVEDAEVEKDDEETPEAEAADEDKSIFGNDFSVFVDKVADALVEKFEATEEPTATTSRLVAKSKQPKEQDGGEERTIAKGEGVFESVIFGQ